MNTIIKTPRFRLVAVLLLTFLFTACISSLLKEPIPAFSNQVKYQAPPNPFEKVKSVSYPSWKNTESQNVILILSSCDAAQQPLATSYFIVSEGIDDVKIENVKLDQVKITRYVAKHIQGTIDGEPVEVQTASFQHKNCTYLSALSGKPTNIKMDQIIWKTFLNSIEFER